MNQNSLELLYKAGWSSTNSGKAIKKTFEFKTFRDAFVAMTRIAFKSEEVNHHPDWNNRYNTLEITWTTHDNNGLTQKDMEMAKFCDETCNIK